MIETVIDIREDFDQCAEWIQGALDHGGNTHDLEDIWAGIVDGRFQFWPAKRGCLVTEILLYPKCKVLHVFLGGGNLDQLLDMIESLEMYAKTIGCKSITVSGRKGWVRVLASRGAKPVRTTLAKEL